MYRLYYSPGACSLAVHIALELIGAAYTLELCSSKNGEGTSRPEYPAPNPKGRIPALFGVSGSAGGVSGLLTKAPAILVHFADVHAHAELLPTDLDAKARCLEWLNWLSGTVHSMSYAQLWRPQRFVFDTALFAAVQAKGRSNLVEQHASIETILSDRRAWGVPQGYSVADIVLFVFWRWGARVGFDMPGAYPAWTRAAARVVDRPAVRRALEQEGLEIEAGLLGLTPLRRVSDRDRER